MSGQWRTYVWKDIPSLWYGETGNIVVVAQTLEEARKLAYKVLKQDHEANQINIRQWPDRDSFQEIVDYNPSIIIGLPMAQVIVNYE
jgi:precorrin-6B methylase 2